jgi:hypothetical protein
VICSAGEGRINIWFSCRFPALVMRAVRCVIVVVSLASVELLGDKLDSRMMKEGDGMGLHEWLNRGLSFRGW